MSGFMKKPCEHCPYRRDVKPYLTPERGEELAYHAQNPYNSFPCHKTTEHDDDSEDGEMLVTERSKECAGFLTLMANECGEDRVPKDFTPSYDVCYTDSFEMAQVYENPEEFFEEPKPKKKKKNK
jgi:hypothetical protein